MSWTIYRLECLTAIILFTCAIMVPLCRNPVWWIHDYPKDIQEKYFETHERIPTQAFSTTVLMKKCAALLLALAVFVGLALLAGAYGQSISSEKIPCCAVSYRNGAGGYSMFSKWSYRDED